MSRQLWDPDFGGVAVPFNNYTAITDPGPTNDSSQRYGAGSTWVNTAANRTWINTSAAVGAAVWQLAGSGAGVVQQGSPPALTVSATLTAAQLGFGILTVNQGAGAPSALQLPLATAMDTQYQNVAAGSAIDFSLINISTVDAEDASITTNTGWTLVGSMDVPAYSAAGSLNASGRFRARKTGTGAWTLYRLS